MKPTKGCTIISLSNVELQRLKSLCCTKRSVGGGHRGQISSKLQRLSKKNFISSGSFFKSADASYHADDDGGDIQKIEL